MRRMDRKKRINKIRNNTACLDHKNAWKDMKTAVIKNVGAALFGITVLGAARMTPYAFNIGPGMEDHDIIYYQEQPENNPAYNNGWTSNGGPGVPIRAAVLTARKITCTRKARETRRHSSTQKQKTARSTSTIPTAAAAGDSGLTGNGPYISRTGIRSRVSGAM